MSQTEKKIYIQFRMCIFLMCKYTNAKMLAQILLTTIMLRFSDCKCVKHELNSCIRACALFTFPEGPQILTTLKYYPR